jgi:hypothetical protein
VTWGQHSKRENVEAQLKGPPRPGGEHLSKAERAAELRASWSIPEPPALWPALVPLFYGWLTLGRDMNGCALYSERLAWLDRNWPEDEFEAADYLFSVLEGCAAEIHAELYPPPKKGAK